MSVEGLPAISNILVGVLASLKLAIDSQIVQFVQPWSELGLLEESVATHVSIGKRLIKIIRECLPDLVAALVSWFAQTVFEVLLGLLLFFGHRILPLVDVVDEPLEEGFLPLELFFGEERLAIPTLPLLFFLLFFRRGLFLRRRFLVFFLLVFLLVFFGARLDSRLDLGLVIGARLDSRLDLGLVIGARFDRGLGLGFNHFICVSI